ncbi:hypothetical protein Btru_017766 [Bulinus truncatus]|nr:hypothetical protein Btru_017766 [Bulinus truncatus]
MPWLVSAACDKDRYGLNCLKTCSDSCWNKTCDFRSGMCDPDCNGYFNPPFCTQVCVNGTYGRNCRGSCTKCLDNHCHHKTGHCSTGCLGYLDFPFCEIRCPKGRHGVNCTSRCHSNCYGGQCNRKSGECSLGCDNYQDPPYCVTPCNGSHGMNCICHELCQECRNMTSICSTCKVGLHYNKERNLCFEVAVDYSRLSSDHGMTDQMSKMLPFLYLVIGLVEVGVFVAAIYRKRKRNEYVANEDNGY